MTLITLPGLIDPHVHLRDPGQTDKEDFFTGTTAALAGGFTTIIDMPNNIQPVLSEDILNEKIKIAKDKIVCDLGFYFGSLGNTSEFKKVENKVKGLKIFLNQTTGGFILDQANLTNIFNSWPTHLPILFHAEEQTLDKVLEVLKIIPRKIHICHVASRYELAKIIEAKELGLPITCGVTPHHLFLTKDDEKSIGATSLMKPRLKPREDIDFLWKNMNAIDIIESDHAPHLLSEKEGDNPPFGIPGLETSLPLLLTAVSENRMQLEDVIRLCHENPAKIFNIPTSKNTFIEIDMNTTYEIKNEDLLTKNKWTPFNGWKAKGKLINTTIRDTRVYENGKITVPPEFGNIVF